MSIRLLLITERRELQTRLKEILRPLDVAVVTGSADSGLKALVEKHVPELIIVSAALLGDAPGESIAAIRNLAGRPDIVVIWRGEHPEARAKIIAAGCLAVLNEAVGDEALRDMLASLVTRRREFVRYRVEQQVGLPQPELDDFSSCSARMSAFLRLVRRVVAPDSSLLILGETGVGKERLARAIHAESPRGAGPFVPVILSAVPETLLESELFGHSKGAFTGASATRRGFFEVASGGTIFLDEIGELPLHVQVKLLRVLQERTIQRLGAEEVLPVDVRVMAATNCDLREAVRGGRFRDDLYYRLSVVTLDVPPLRDRAEDVPPLLERYLADFRVKFSRNVKGFSEEAVEALCRYKWPGNIRELINVVERAVLLCEQKEIQLADLPADVYAAPHGQVQQRAGIDIQFADQWLDQPWKLLRDAVLADCERQYVSALLRTAHGNLNEAAMRAGINPRTLYDMMQRHGLKKEDFRFR